MKIYTLIIMTATLWVITIIAIMGTWQGMSEVKRTVEQIEFNPNITVESPPIIIKPESRYWNETEAERVRRECKLLCVGYEYFISVPNENGCVCCSGDVRIEPYWKCVYYDLELEEEMGF